MFQQEVSEGQRFEFGKNWRQFLDTVGPKQIEMAELALSTFLGNMQATTFLDVGCGSGLSSLAAHKLGAKVRSFDYDPHSVACTKELQRKYGVHWLVEEGSALNAHYLETLGQYDIVYSWGVLHHTGAMWEAIDKVSKRVKPGGRFFIAIYNDNGRHSRMWLRIKRLYNRSPRPIRWLILAASLVRMWGPTTVRDFLRGKPFYSWRNYSSRRGMSAWHDLVDWVGGYPYEVATPAEIDLFLRERGFKTEKTVLRTGCNEFVYRLKLPALRCPPI
jgi:2-polyprenyl-3-methyl-5-hydroxy-6-metoxy-1,4-benzoquinol methylase